jgi:hypothetical protein
MSGAPPNADPAARTGAGPDRRRWAGALLAALGVTLGALALALPAARRAGTSADPAAALREGNRLVRSGRLEEALAAYAAGWSPAAAHGGAGGVLAYNLGTTAHRLRRFPEAVLWYRRAAAAGLDDPWLTDNLELARAEAGAIELPAPGALARLAAHSGALAAAGVALAWLAVAAWLVAAAGRGPWWGWLAAGGAAVAVFGGAALLGARGPEPAVLLAACGAGDAGLAAASEVWVGPAKGGRRAVLGAAPGLRCPEQQVAAVGGPRFP